ncbi:hypothetical protein [Nocardia sp. CA-135398]|uniref:hypothetical protein n=1 Tax=Nocardia sp. CA-135398 TaxID=3239977 RepID=UPI003D9615F5
MVDRILRGSAMALRLTKFVADAPAHPYTDLLAQAVLFEDPEKFERMTAFVDRKRDKETERG